MNSTQITALVIILVYMAVTVAIGLFASRKKTEEKQSNDDFLMASKSLGLVIGAPAEHWINPNQEEKDAQWPYRIRITGSQPIIQ